MVFDDKGRLFLISNGSDDKGIRRITNDPDTVYVLNPSEKNITFYGWPDFFGKLGDPVTNTQFNEFPLQNYSNKPLIENLPLVTHPLLDLGVSVGNTQAANSTNETIGYKGKIFVGEFGTIAPVTHVFHSSLTSEVGQVMGKMVGQKVVIVVPQNETVSNFITLSNPATSFRPVGLGFSPDWKYIVFGQH